MELGVDVGLGLVVEAVVERQKSVLDQLIDLLRRRAVLPVRQHGQPGDAGVAKRVALPKRFSAQMKR